MNTNTITIKLDENEFLELGAMSWSSQYWQAQHMDQPVARLFVKIREAVEKQATPGQRLYLDNLTNAINEAFAVNEVDASMITDGFKTIVDHTTNTMNEAG